MTVSIRLAASLGKIDQPRPTLHSTTARATVAARRKLAGKPHRSSSVPRTHSPAQQASSHANPVPGANTAPAVEKPHRRAAPPR